MNYFAHGIRFVDRPYFLAGTAVPDWLSVVDRKVRMRSRRVEPFADGSGGIQAEVAAGVLQHLDDDQWFHRTQAFMETSGELTRLFQSLLGPDDGTCPSFLGHVTTELLLDAVLIAEAPTLLDRYYATLNSVDAAAIQETVNRMAKHPTDRLADWILGFVSVQFLRDYLHSARLLFRLNQVLRRIKLKQLPDETQTILEAAREIVQRRRDELLPSEHFGATIV